MFSQLMSGDRNAFFLSVYKSSKLVIKGQIIDQFTKLPCRYGASWLMRPVMWPGAWEHTTAPRRSWRGGHEGSAIPLAQQLDELPAGKRRHHSAGERQGPLTDHVEAGKTR